MKSAVLSRANSIGISWIFYSFHASTCFITALWLLSLYCVLTFLASLLLFCLPVLSTTFHLSPRLPASSYSWISLCLGLWAGLWQGLLWLSLPQASKAKEWDRLCHIMRALLFWLWLRVVIQNWCGEEPILTSCQRWMFSAGRQASGNDNVGYASWALTTPFTLWHTWWYLTQCLLLSLRHIDCAAVADRIQVCVACADSSHCFLFFLVFLLELDLPSFEEFPNFSSFFFRYG